MTADDQEGHSEARTRADPPENQPSAGASAPSSAAIEAGAALPGADPLDLVAGLPDGEGDDVLALAAEKVAAPARARGRPAGSVNRKNGDMIRYLAARGHRDPMVTLSMIQSADFGALCKMVGATNAKQKTAVLGIIRGAAADLMPYHHSRKPQQLELPEGGGSMRPVMVFGDINVTTQSDADFWSLGSEKPNEINGEFVRDAEPSRTD